MILIIGGMGFIGLNTARPLVGVGEKVVISQHSAHRVPDVLRDRMGSQVFTARLDVTNVYEVFDVVRRHQVTSIINLMAPPARSVSTQADYELYTAGLVNVLEAARVFGLRRVSLGSSVAVYNGLPSGPFLEDLGLPVHSPTQVSAFKKGMEMHAHFYAAQAKLDVIALRIASIYGPLYYSMHNPIGRLHAAAHQTDPDFSDRPDGRIFAEDQGDWTYVNDVARGIQMVHTAERLSHRVYNVGSGRARSNRDIVEAVRSVVPDANVDVLKPGRAPANSLNPATDLTRIKTDVGYEPEYTLETGIATYIEWLRTHPQ